MAAAEIKRRGLELQQELLSIAMDLEKHERNVKRAKIVGTAASILGGALLIGGTIMTGGLALPALVGGLSAAGAVTSVGAELVGKVITRDKINKAQEKWDRFSESIKADYVVKRKNEALSEVMLVLKACGGAISNNAALGTNATFHGTNAAALGENAAALGKNATALGKNVAGLGKNAGALGKNTAVIGKNAASLGRNTAVIGKNAAALGRNTAVIGKNAAALGKNTAVIGKNAVAHGKNAAALGKNSGSLVPVIGAFFLAVNVYDLVCIIASDEEQEPGSLLRKFANNILSEYIDQVIQKQD